MASAQRAEAKSSPMVVKDMLMLPQVGIAADVIKFKNVFIQSHNFICVREEDKKGVAIIDTASKAVTRYQVPVDGAIMNPATKVVALRVGNNLQIFNMEMKSMMKKAVLTNPVYWRWLDPKTIAIVTDTAVYHWSMEGDTQPQKMFDRPAYTGGPVQVLNYRASADQKWLLLGGIAANAQTGGVNGVLSVFSVDLQAAQPTMDSHAACFMNLTLQNREKPSHLFAFTMKQGDTLRVNLIEVGVPKDQAFSQSIQCRLADKDFPVSLLADNKHGCLFLLSRDGVVVLMEVQSGKVLLTTQVAQSVVFASCEHAENGIVSIDQSGRVIHYAVDEKNIINYITTVMHDVELGVQMARWYDLEGVTHIFKQHFDQLMASQRFNEAMDLAVTSPKGCLRTADTIQALKQAATLPNAPNLILYFQSIIKRGALNKIESIELVRLILANRAASQQQAIDKITDLIKEQKLEPSEELGDLLRSTNIQLALSVYLRAKVPEKVISCFLTLAAQETDAKAAETHLNNIMEYSKRVSFTPDLPLLVGQLARANPERGLQLALILIKNTEGPKVEINQLVNTFMGNNDVKSTTAILLEYLKPRGDREEDAALQTKLLEINLLSNPQIADSLLDADTYHLTHYDRLRIAQLCEHAQLYQRALEHYTDLSDIKRVLANTHALNPEFLLEYFGHMTPENCLECLRDLLKYNLQQNIRLVVEVAKKWNDYLTPTALVTLFEEFKSYNGLYFYLGAFVNTTTDPKIVFKYIEAAVRLGQFREVERVCRDNEHYDGKEVKDFLIAQNLKDPRALIYVCDRFNFVPELTQYLYGQNSQQFLEAYVSRMNAKATPAVVGTLLDLNANEDWIKTKLLSPVRPPADDKDFVSRLVGEVEKRNRLKILRQWLEARVAENSEDPAVHNGLAKIYVDVNNNPQAFLTSNKFYESKVVGAYCESRDPHLAFVAYRRANGECDKELIAVTNKNGFFKDQARYLVERRDEALWATVLAEGNEFRRQLIDQVVATALPESRVADEVSVAVRAFMAANLPNELIELLERIILHGPAEGEFHSNKNLQNLLILTAIKADPKRVMDYVKRLDNYDGPDIAKIACSDQYKLYEEAFFIYKKFGKGEESIQVLLEHIQDMARAVEFAQYTDQPPVWSLLAKAQLEHKEVKEAISSFLKANDATCFEGVLAAGKAQSLYAELIPYILMARQKIKEPVVDNELIYCYARTNKLAELEDFLTTPSKAQFQAVGEQLFDEKMFQAARILFAHINNYAKLAICLVRLQLFQEAVDAARKANNINTWKDVCFACVDSKNFRLAAVCGVNIIVYHEHLMDLCKYYEMAGYHDELIALLEQGLLLDRTHQGIFTQLAVMYSKYKEEKLFEHIKLFITRLNIPTVLATCQKNLQWPECVFLYTHYDQFDNAIDIMIEHSPSAWEHKQFKEILSHVPNTEVYYKAIEFYLLEHPTLLNDLLLELASKLDHSRVVNMLRNAKHLPLADKYLLFVQRENLPTVNEAINELYLNEERYKLLRESIDAYDKFDQIALAQRCESHQLLEFRRIAAYLYKLNKRWERSIELSQKDRQWLDAMETAAQSKSQDLAERLLYYFVENGEFECFAACLFTCYELIRPDIVLEIAWRNNLSDYAMPYLVQIMRHWNDKFVSLSEKVEEHEKSLHAVEAKQDEKKDQSHVGVNMPVAGPYLALPPPQMVYQGPTMGAPMGGMPPQGMGVPPNFGMM